MKKEAEEGRQAPGLWRSKVTGGCRGPVTACPQLCRELPKMPCFLVLVKCREHEMDHLNHFSLHSSGAFSTVALLPPSPPSFPALDLIFPNCVPVKHDSCPRPPILLPVSDEVAPGPRVSGVPRGLSSCDWRVSPTSTLPWASDFSAESHSVVGDHGPRRGGHLGRCRCATSGLRPDV